MGCDRDTNTYYWPEYKKVESGVWNSLNYDTNGKICNLHSTAKFDLVRRFVVAESYSASTASAYDPSAVGYDGVGAGLLPEY